MFAGILFALIRSQLHAIAAGLVAFLVLFCGVVWSGAPRQYPIPVIPLLFASILGSSIWFSFSKSGGALARALPLSVLVGFQAFRLPLELILYHWANIGTVPATMTWTGQNFDIISGIVAALAGPVANRSKVFAWIATIIGIALLFNVLRVVVLSSPFPFSWPLERPLQLILYMPYALIGPLFVAPALIGHLITIRALLKK